MSGMPRSSELEPKAPFAFFSCFATGKASKHNPLPEEQSCASMLSRLSRRLTGIERQFENVRMIHDL
jgi:hypothetical protein